MAILAIHTDCFKLLILAISCKNLCDAYPDTTGAGSYPRTELQAGTPMKLGVFLTLIVLHGCQATISQRGPQAAPSESEAERDQRIRQHFGEHCRFERACAGLWGIDCDAAIDGPYYYVEPRLLEGVSRCGGYCMGGRCEDCPPRAWTCPVY